MTILKDTGLARWMAMGVLKRHMTLLALLACAPVAAVAQAPDVDFLELDGESALVLPHHEAFELSDGGTLEFWIQPDFAVSSDPSASDKVILASVGPEGAAYILAITANKKGLVLASGDEEIVIPFEFGSFANHVALRFYDDGMTVTIDGRVVVSDPFTLAVRPAHMFMVGTMDDGSQNFTGAIGRLRFWDLALSDEDIVAFRTRSVVFDNDEPHPEYEFLSAESAFNRDDGNGEIVFVDELAD